MADRQRTGGWSGAIAELPRWLWSCLAGGSWKLALGRLLLAAAVFGLGALLFVSAGLVPVAASQGHWPITRVLLHFAMRRSVRTHALAVKPPPAEDRLLDTEAMVLKGAGHYAGGCLACHGAPGHPRAEVMLHSVPEPPYLPPKIAEWNDRELFWIVSHGIKYTAMPAWPTQQRDDEVRAMVAFLRRLPGMTPARFRQLAYGGATAGVDGSREAGAIPSTRANPAPSTLADCARCHGVDGEGRGGAVPRLAGQREAYLLESLRAYARGDRHSGIMQPVAAALDDAGMVALARHYASLDIRPAAPVDAHPDAAAIERGARLATRGDAADRVPACVACHDTGTGPGTADRNPHYPLLAGQHPDYLRLQLTLFNSGTRGGSAYAPIMHTVAGSLEPGDIRDLSAFFASRPAASEVPAR